MMIIKILQWNVWYKEDPWNIAGFIKNVSPDIACLQEVTTGVHKNIDVIQTICNSMNYADVHYKQAQSWRTDEGGIMGQGNAIFSKYKIESDFFTFLQPETFDTQDFAKEGRVYVEVTVKIAGKPLTIGTTHLSYTHKFIDTDDKNKQVDTLLKKISKKDSHYILTGDFNAPPTSVVIDRISAHLKNCGPDLPEKTWTTKPFEEGNFKEEELNWRLDYVFSTRDVKVVNSDILQTNFSDHLPILTTVEI